MGHRANYVLIKNGKAKAYEDHWGALACLFAINGGPKSVEDSMKGNEKTTELMEWCWAEGGFLLDHDKKRLVTFGYVDFDPDEAEGIPPDVVKAINAFIDAANEPQTLFAHVSKKWKGWTLEWNEAGTDAFAAHLASRGIKSIKTKPPSKDTHAKPYIVTIGKAPTKKLTMKKSPRKPSRKPAKTRR
jgi:hypothetical protein